MTILELAGIGVEAARRSSRRCCMSRTYDVENVKKVRPVLEREKHVRRSADAGRLLKRIADGGHLQAGP